MKESMTKKSLVKEAMRPWIMIMGGIDLFLLSLLVIGVFTNKNNIMTLLLMAGTFIVFEILIGLGVLSIPLKGIQRLKEQEKRLKVCFDKEMEGKCLHNDIYKDQQWFVAVGGAYLIVFCKGYIKKIGKIEADTKMAYVYAETIDGEEIKIQIGRMYVEQLERLIKWLKKDTQVIAE